MAKKNSYTTKYFCDNCGECGEITLPLGTKLTDTVCPHCGCKTISLQPTLPPIIKKEPTLDEPHFNPNEWKRDDWTYPSKWVPPTPWYCFTNDKGEKPEGEF